MYLSQRGLVLTTTPWVEHLSLVPFGLLFFKNERGSVGLLVPTYPGSEIDERVRCGEGEEGFMTVVGWDQGGHVLVDHITTDRMTCFSL
jgi:hypothetical protein